MAAMKNNCLMKSHILALLQLTSRKGNGDAARKCQQLGCQAEKQLRQEEFRMEGVQSRMKETIVTLIIISLSVVRSINPWFKIGVM